MCSGAAKGAAAARKAGKTGKAEAAAHDHPKAADGFPVFRCQSLRVSIIIWAMENSGTGFDYACS